MRTLMQAENEANEVVNGWVTGAALTGWIPGSTVFFAAGDMVMIRQVADAFGIGVFDEEAVKTHFLGMCGSIVGGMAAAEVAGWVPVLGWAAKSGILARKARIMGNLVINYFRDLSPLVQ